MGLLAPLYALAALAVAGPILFHLIRRQPEGEFQFSSLMFLQPSPPTLSRRSRIDQWLLLALRGLAILLIAFAFARPYFREESMLNINLDGRNLVLLLDTSASMQRDEIWAGANQEITEILDGLASEDRVSFYTIDRELHPVVPVESESLANPTTTHDAVRQAIRETTPTWFRSELAEGLSSLADLLNSVEISGQVQVGKSSEIILVSDLHEKSGLESLQGYPWPESIELDVRRIVPSVLGNARVSLMNGGDEEQGESGSSYRVRVENTPLAESQRLQLAWANSRGPLEGTYTQVQVPAGQVRVLPMGDRPATADRVRVLGDAWEGDNDVYVVETEKILQPIGYIGVASEKPEEDPGYFLAKAPLDTSLVTRSVSVLEPKQWMTGIGSDFHSLLVEAMPSLRPQLPELKRFAEQGGTLLVLLSHPMAEEASDLLSELFDVEIQVGEAQVQDFALVGWVDYKSPVFSPFADPRFNDFSKIRFWSHRRVEVPEGSELRTLARFDDTSPLLLRKSVGEGNIWLLTAGWQPTASTFALSSKFIPVLQGILDPASTMRRSQATFEVGEPIPLSSEGSISILDSEGNELPDTVAKAGLDSVEFYVPGIYKIQQGEFVQAVAIQVPANEGYLDPLDRDVFEQYGVKLGRLATETERKESARQMKVEELENKQRLWQWLLAAGLLVLALETLLAGWFARKADRQLAAASEAIV